MSPKLGAKWIWETSRMARRQPEGPPPPPIVQRIRIRYAKRGRLRFSSHRDFARAFERALRRAGVPVAFSAGFTPHPKVSYVGAAPTGVASEAEYLELGLAERIDASAWQVVLPGVDLAAAAAAVRALLDRDAVEVERRTKDGRRLLDARAPVVSLVAGAPPGGSAASCAILEVVVRQVTPAVRPDDVLAALRAVAGLAPTGPPRATRLAQGRLDDRGRLADPLAPDRTAVLPAIEAESAPRPDEQATPSLG